jgi:hypothetical protein
MSTIAGVNPDTSIPSRARQRLRCVFGHPGSGPVRATNLDVYPDLDWVSVVLSNYDSTIDPILERQLISQQG